MTASSGPSGRLNASRFSDGKDDIERVGRVVNSTAEVRIKFVVGAPPYRALWRPESLPDRLQRLAVNHARRFGAQPKHIARLRASLKRAAAGNTSITVLTVELTSDGNIRFAYASADGTERVAVTLMETSKDD
jgi:hypothetical protein